MKPASCLLAALLLASSAQAQDADDLAQQLSNPVASLIQLPLQLNYNEGLGAGDGEQTFINVQPVIPFSLGEDWNLISRTIVPVVSQTDVFPTNPEQLGFGNVVQSFFFSPKAPTAGGLIWGAGPVIQIPTSTDDLGRNQWGLGVTGVALRQSGPWTVGMLANHIWSVSNNDSLGKTSATFLQPFVSYTTSGKTTYSLNSEATYDWVGEEWSVPINANVSQLVLLGGRPVSIGAGVRYWAESPEGQADGWGARLSVTYLFPR